MMSVTSWAQQYSHRDTTHCPGIHPGVPVSWQKVDRPPGAFVPWNFRSLFP